MGEGCPSPKNIAIGPYLSIYTNKALTTFSLSC